MAVEGDIVIVPETFSTRTSDPGGATTGLNSILALLASGGSSVLPFLFRGFLVLNVKT